MERIKSKISCDKTLQLIHKSLKAGYINPNTGKTIRTTEGTPQGSVVSPLLANIVLDVFDKQVECLEKSFGKGKKRARNKRYDAITSRIQGLRKSRPGSRLIKELAVKRRTIPSLDMLDPNYKRMMYLRFADDFVILISGSFDEAQHIKHRIADFLHKKCGLELNKEKTLVTATKDGFKFLGARCIRISAQKAGFSRSQAGNPARYRMRMRMEIPVKDLIKRLQINKFIKVDPKGIPVATARKDLVNFSHDEIVNFYNHRIQGLVAFYSFAANRTNLRKVIMFLHLSCALTLTLKLKLRTKKKTFSKFGRYLTDPDTGTKLRLPDNLKVLHSYAGKEVKLPEDNLKAS